jgi:hypothetical protein
LIALGDETRSALLLCRYPLLLLATFDSQPTSTATSLDYNSQTNSANLQSTPPIYSANAANISSAVAVAAARAAAAADRLLTLDSLPHLFLSFGNSAYFSLVHNWAVGVQQIGAPFIIAGGHAQHLKALQTTICYQLLQH